MPRTRSEGIATGIPPEITTRHCASATRTVAPVVRPRRLTCRHPHAACAPRWTTERPAGQNSGPRPRCPDALFDLQDQGFLFDRLGNIARRPHTERHLPVFLP